MAGCCCQPGAPAPQHPAFTNQSWPLQPGRGVNRAHLSGLAAMPLPGTQLNHYLVRMSPSLCAARDWPAAAAAPAIWPIGAGLEADSPKLAVNSFWLGGESLQSSQPWPFFPGQLQDSHTWTSGWQGAREAVSGGNSACAVPSGLFVCMWERAMCF